MKAVLKDGCQVDLQIVTSPSPEEFQEIRNLLHHKPSPYLNHIEDFHGSGSCGIIERLEWRFYLARVEDAYVGNICTWEHDGIGILGHVFTLPEWRGLGIADALLRFQDADFQARNGKIMELNTGYQSMPYRMYLKHGYEDVPGVPGSMFKATVNKAWPSLYTPGETRLVDFRWNHWPSANLLFLMENPAFVRAAGIGVYGASHLEGPVIHCRERIWNKEEEPKWKVVVLENQKGAITAWASLQWDLNWSRYHRRLVFDLFFHPDFGKAMESEMGRLEIPKGTISYSTPHDPKNPVLERVGFRGLGKITGFFPNGEDLMVWTKPD